MVFDMGTINVTGTYTKFYSQGKNIDTFLIMITK